MKRRVFSALAAAALALGSSAALAQACSFPTKPARWIVPYPAGGGSDYMARSVSQAMQADTPQPITVDNRPGGNGAIAVAELMRAPRDGHTFINVDNGVMVFNPALYKSLSYDPARDLVPVTLLGRLPMILVTSPASGITDARDFIAKAKAQPGRLSYGSAGAGSPQHMAMELLKKVTGTFMVHIPYRGSAPALADLAGGQVVALMSDYAAARPFITSGKARPLAVAHSSRLPYLPDVPTLAELGIQGAETSAWVGVAVASGTPPEAIQALQKSLSAGIAQPAATKRYRDAGIDPVNITAQEFQAQVKAETVRWHKLIKEQGITLD